MFVVQIALIFCLATTLSQGGIRECPPEDQLRPCRCSKPKIYGKEVISLTCRDATIDDIRYVVTMIRNYDIDDIGLFNFNTNGKVPDNFLEDTTVQEIGMHQTNFSFVPAKKPFDGLQNLLTKLVLTRVYIGFPGIPLDHLDHLRDLIVTLIEMKTLQSDWVLRWPVNLENLDITNCQIEVVEPLALQPLTKLKKLVLQKNQISIFNRTILAPQLDDLEFISLRGNHLSELEANFFEGMPKLRIVDLSNNRFLRLHNRYFEPVRQHLKDVDFNGNRLECLTADMMWICSKEYRHVSIKGRCAEPKNMVGLELGTKDFCSEIGKITEP